MKCRPAYCCIILISGIAFSQPPEAAPTLRVDPLLIAQATEVWGVIAQRDNPIWPGWNAATTPLLFYLPGVQDVLINHPKPPVGFRRYEGPVSWPGASIYVRDGRTFFEYDGQNTVLEVEGVPTLVVADTLSNRRNQVQSWLIDPRPASVKNAELGWDQLQGSPYDQITMIAHEAFHAYQRRQAPNKGGGEEALTRYPTIAVENTVGFALEGDALADALRATTPADQRAHALRWLAIRRERRNALSAEAVSYEDRMEFLEGLAKYVEFHLLEMLEGRTPRPAMAWAQGFSGYTNLKPQRDGLIRQMVKMMRGEANVNNDPYGASPLRMRLYYSGMGIAVILDRLNPSWKERIFMPDTTLTGLATETLKPTEAELAAALAVAKSQSGYTELKAQKVKLERDGETATRKLMEEIESGPHTTLTLDYSALADARVGLAFTPFGILRVDDTRTIYRLIPITAKVGSTTFRQSRALPLLHDRAAKRITCQLQEPVTAAAVEKLFGVHIEKAEPVDLASVALPGVTLDGGSAVVSLNNRKLLIRAVASTKP